MPSTIVQIEWDEPDDVTWLNRFNIELALSAYCKNTHFTVTDVEVDDGGPVGVGMLNLIMEAVRQEERNRLSMPGNDWIEITSKDTLLPTDRARVLVVRYKQGEREPFYSMAYFFLHSGTKYGALFSGENTVYVKDALSPNYEYGRVWWRYLPPLPDYSRKSSNQPCRKSWRRQNDRE